MIWYGNICIEGIVLKTREITHVESEQHLQYEKTISNITHFNFDVISSIFLGTRCFYFELQYLFYSFNKSGEDCRSSGI